jgi:hypothetical protein
MNGVDEVDKLIWDFIDAHYGESLRHNDHTEPLRELITSVIAKMTPQTEKEEK